MLHKKIRLEVLSDEESSRLFQMMNDDAVKDVEWQDIATQVAQSCAGLPAVIVTMAKSLKNKPIYHWKDALKNLKRAARAEIPEIVSAALEFSYNQLEDDKAKQVFLLYAVLGTSTCVSDLLKYTWVLGIFKHVDAIEDARDKLYKRLMT